MTSPTNSATNKDLESIAPELRATIERWYERLADMHGAGRDVLANPALVRVVACSEFAGNVLLAQWPAIGDHLQSFDEAPDLAELSALVERIATGDCGQDEVRAELRRARNRWLLHVLWREVAGVAQPDETLIALSDGVDELLRGAAIAARLQMQDRFGSVRDVSGEIVPMVILAMGKLGGRELNFSSDIDVIFTYAADGESDGDKTLHAQDYFGRFSRLVVSLIDEATEDGFVHRTDTRLRPFGDSGPPVVSFTALESYLLQHGREWERYAYVKARIVGERPSDTIAADLFDNLITPFVYRRYLDFGVFESLREMHAMISAEVQRRDLADNIKIGPGGIREIEFIVQSLQLVRGGGNSELREPSLRRVLPLLADARGIGASTVQALDEAYCFLRRLENFMQAIRDKQTHELPSDPADRARLCCAMGFEDWDALLTELNRQRAAVTAQFDEVAFRGEREENLADETGYEDLWESAASAEAWQDALGNAGFEHAGEIASNLAAFRDATVTRKLDKTAAARLQTFVSRLLVLAQQCRRADVAVKRCLSVVEKILRRSAYLALLNENRLAAERFVGLCERSSYITAEIARFPVLLDELLDPRLLTGPIAREELRRDLDERLATAAAGDTEARTELLARYQRATMFRVAVADFHGGLPLMKVSDSLTFLAETILEEALAMAWSDLAERHGAPHYEIDGETRPAGFGIVAYGKLGGLELSYGSDLDIVFLHDSSGSKQQTDGDPPLDNALYFSRLVRRLVHILTTHTNSGVLYEIDTRLRPSGRKGLLVTSTEAFERYQEENAWTWEHQALLRARAVAGSASIGREFERIRDETLRRRVHRESLRQDVIDMRGRMRDELDRSDASRFDLKQGQGGIGDIEFIVQYLVLKNAGEHADVIEFSDNIRQLDALAACDAIAGDTALELQEIYRQYRQRQHHLVLDDESTVISSEQFKYERKRVGEIWEAVFST